MVGVSRPHGLVFRVSGPQGLLFRVSRPHGLVFRFQGFRVSRPSV